MMKTRLSVWLLNHLPTTDETTWSADAIATVQDLAAEGHAPSWRDLFSTFALTFRFWFKAAQRLAHRRILGLMILSGLAPWASDFQPLEPVGDLLFFLVTIPLMLAAPLAFREMRQPSSRLVTPALPPSGVSMVDDILFDPQHPYQDDPRLDEVRNIMCEQNNLTAMRHLVDTSGVSCRHAWRVIRILDGDKPRYD